MPIEVTESGITTSVRLLPAKAASPIEVTELPIVISVRLFSEKA